MEKRKITIFDIMMCITSLVFVVLGVLTIIFSSEKYARTNDFLGIFIIVSSVPPILMYFLFRSYENAKKIPAIVFASMSLLFGVVCIVADELTTEHICVIWGVLIIISCVYYLYASIGGIKHSKLEIGSVIVTIAELVFAILLIIKLEDGVTNHLIFMGISFILKGIKCFLQYWLSFKEQN